MDELEGIYISLLDGKTSWYSKKYGWLIFPYILDMCESGYKGRFNYRYGMYSNTLQEHIKNGSFRTCPGCPAGPWSIDELLKTYKPYVDEYEIEL